MKARGPLYAPDGQRWPMPIVAVSQEEQLPWCFGAHPYADRATDRSIVASDVTDEHSAIVETYGEPFHMVSANLHTADYWLVGPEGPLDGFVGIERKEADACSSMTVYMDRFKEEMDRLMAFRTPAIVLSSTWEALRRKYPQHHAALLGAVAAIAVRNRIPIYPAADRFCAESFAAWILWEQWQAYLTANPVALAWAREEERRRGIEREHRKRQRRVA